MEKIDEVLERLFFKGLKRKVIRLEESVYYLISQPWNKHRFNKDDAKTLTAASPATASWNEPRCPLTGEQTKMWCMYTIEYHLAIKRMQSMTSLTCAVKIK